MTLAEKNLGNSHQTSCVCSQSWIPAGKRYEVNECVRRGVYWVNLKFKDGNSIDASLYTYLCKAIYQLMGVFWHSLKLCSTAARLTKTKADIAKKSFHSYSSCAAAWKFKKGDSKRALTPLWVSNFLFLACPDFQK